VTTVTRPRPVLCVTEHEHRSRAIADDIRRGRFTIAGETRTLGTDPDWHSHDLPRDEEWRIEWVKFGWGLDLAHAGHQRPWEELTASWIRRCEPDEDAPEVTARRILNWIYAWQRFDVADEHAARLRASLADQVEHVRANLALARNHRTLELYALFVAALAFPELGPPDLGELDRNLATDFHPDGVHVEASTHYHAIALRSFVGARENARRHGIELPAGFEERVARACRFLAHCTRPDGTIAALSDADTGDYRPLLALAGEPQATGHASFPDGGYHVQRSGSRFLIFDCGPLGEGGHGHYDLLSFEAHAGGRPLVLDPGRGSYSEAPPNLRRWFRGTRAHNTVCVDGLDQTPYTRGRPLGPVAQGRFLGRETAPGLDVLHGEATSPAYEVVHRRRISFVDDAYWVIDDELQGERGHVYDLRFHLPPGPREPRTLAIEGADAVAVERGWIAPRYGELLDAPVVSAVARGRSARFRTVLTP
jgi:uncharacterized heparinase superfamily protein